MFIVGYDWDGVGSNSFSRALEATNRALEEINMEKVTAERLKEALSDFSTYHQQMKIPDGYWEEFQQRYKFHKRSLPMNGLVPGFIDHLRRAKHSKVIVTSNDVDPVEEILASEGITGVEVYRNKFPQPKIELFNVLGLESYVGDTIQDAKDAIEAGIIPFLMASKYSYCLAQNLVNFAAKNPVHLVRNFRELEELL